MRITPLDVHEQTFRLAFRGFDAAEVDAFLQRVADELERLAEERDHLRSQLEDERKARNTLEEALATARTLQETILEKAREEAEVLRSQARLTADRMLADANEDLLRLQREARELAERRSLWLSEIAVLARTLGEWVEQKAAEESAPLETVFLEPELARKGETSADSGDEGDDP